MKFAKAGAPTWLGKARRKGLIKTPIPSDRDKGRFLPICRALRGVSPDRRKTRAISMKLLVADGEPLVLDTVNSIMELVGCEVSNLEDIREAARA